jgi:wobble nucleotide-excising tRNase
MFVAVSIDDPVVSFDDNRIKVTCTELKRISAEFEQIIILTHYKTVIRQLLKSQAKALYIKIEKDRVGAKSMSTG